MAIQVKKVDTVTIDLASNSGSLYQVYAAFKRAHVSIISSWAYELCPGKARIILYSSDTEKTKKVLTEMGKKPQLGKACYATGDDHTGVYAELLEQIKEAGVNLIASDAFGVEGRFAAIFFCKDEDLKALCSALHC